MPTSPNQPVLSVATSTTTGIAPPRQLGRHGAQFWERVQHEYAITDCGGVELLMQCCLAIDRAEALAEIIARDGEVIRTRSGTIKSHPAVRDELTARGLVMRAVQRLGIDVEPVKSPGRPGQSLWLETQRMSGTRRVPINRRHTTPITPRAVELFVAMGRLRCSCGPPKSGTPYKLCAGCERWHNLQVELNNELRCRPWEWPCVSRPGSKHAGSTAWNERIAATMKALREAAKAQRAQEISANVDQPGAPVGPANA